MRAWSFHPKYLDPSGLWRGFVEPYRALQANTGGLTAKGKPRVMHRNHNGLSRWKKRFDRAWLLYLNTYLSYILNEAGHRNVNWLNRWRMEWASYPIPCIPLKLSKDSILVTTEQIKYEWQHYLAKLKTRRIDYYEQMKNIVIPDPHPMFYVVKGPIESWEKIIRG